MLAVANVLIVGAGMAGMTLGVALKRAGIACEIAEIRPDRARHRHLAAGPGNCRPRAQSSGVQVMYPHTNRSGNEGRDC